MSGAQLQLRIFLALRAAQHVVAVARGGRGVEDQNRLGAHARGFFVLVGPAAVVGERAAAEELRIVGRRFIGEQHQHFALHVDALEIVPVKFGRDDAVADEHRFGVELIVRLLQLAFADEIVQPFEGDGLDWRLPRSSVASGDVVTPTIGTRWK